MRSFDSSPCDKDASTPRSEVGCGYNSEKKRAKARFLRHALEFVFASLLLYISHLIVVDGSIRTNKNNAIVNKLTTKKKYWPVEKTPASRMVYILYKSFSCLTKL
jgi:hypothetical protein